MVIDVDCAFAVAMKNEITLFGFREELFEVSRDWIVFLS